MSVNMKKLDFHFVLAMIAIFGSAASLYFQLQDAGYEYETLTSSMAPVIRDSNNASDINATIQLNQELNDLEVRLEALTF